MSELTQQCGRCFVNEKYDLFPSFVNDKSDFVNFAELMNAFAMLSEISEV